MRGYHDTLTENYQTADLVFGARQALQDRSKVVSLASFLNGNVSRDAKDADQFELIHGEEPTRLSDYATARRAPSEQRAGSGFKLDNSFIDSLASRVKPARKGAGFRFQ